MRHKSAWHWFIVLIVFDKSLRKFDEKDHLHIQHEKYKETMKEKMESFNYLNMENSVLQKGQNQKLKTKNTKRNSKLEIWLPNQSHQSIR